MATRLDAPRAAAPPASDRAVRPPIASFRLSASLTVVTAVTCLLTLALPDVLRGPAAMNGSARGTALVVLVLTLPVLVTGMVMAARGSAFGVLVWLGAVAHVLYQSVLFLFATPFNDLFLLDVAMLGLALWTTIALVAGIDVVAIRARIRPGVPERAIALFVWVVAGLNAMGWLAFIVPGLLDDGTPRFLDGTGMTTNPIHVQDLAFWLPLMAVGAWWLWQRRALGSVIVGAMLTMWLLEAICVAVDQWMGQAAAPGSAVATGAGAVMFAVLAVVTTVPWLAFYRCVER